MYSVEVDNFSHWRHQARGLLERQVPPNAIVWQAERQHSLLVDASSENFLSRKVTAPNLSIPRDFFSLAKPAACYRDESRWSLLYSVAWRLMFENKQLLGDKLDAQVARLNAMRKAVGRDKHKMEAFVRFRLIKGLQNNNKTEKDSIKQDFINKIKAEGKEEYFIAWFDPEHLILPLVTPFFVKRFYNMSWSILTPDACVHWDREKTMFTDGVAKPPNIEDSLEELWRAYYVSIFNPARLKLKAMQSEMPKKYWVNLPEASLIAELTRSALKRTDAMISRGATDSWEKTTKSVYVKKRQKDLRLRSIRDTK